MARRVRHSPGFVAKARSLFPPGGSTTGRASFELFERLILRAAELQFSRQFDDLPIGSTTYPRSALIIYAVLLSDGTVETIDLEVDEECWELIGDDPDD